MTPEQATALRAPFPPEKIGGWAVGYRQGYVVATIQAIEKELK